MQLVPYYYVDNFRYPAIFVKDTIYIIYKHRFQKLVSIQVVFLHKASVDEDYSGAGVN